MNSYAKFNAGGMAVFVLGFAFVMAFFAYSICVNPGPIGNKSPTVAVPFSAKDQEARAEQWRKSTPDAVALGEKLFAVNCTTCHIAGQGSDVLSTIQSGSARSATSVIGLYNSIFRGIDGKHRFSYIGKQERWALLHFISSKAPNLKSNSSGEWNALIATDY